MTRHTIREGEVTFLDLSPSAVRVLVERRVCNLTPAAQGTWRVTNVNRVGSIRTADGELHIRPKVDIARLFWMLARGRRWGEWFDETVEIGETPELTVAIANGFAHWAEHALARGALQGYRSVESSESAIKGKWLVTEQVRRRSGLPLPVELRYDDYTLDIAENQLLRGAAVRLLRFPSLPAPLRQRLVRIERQLSGVELGTSTTASQVAIDRRNIRYQPAIELASLVLDNRGVDHHHGTLWISGYLLDLATVFEDFVEAEVRRASRDYPGALHAQYVGTLDQDRRVEIRPDLVWRRDGHVTAILDAKYKIEKVTRGHPNADIYQMLAYCIRHGVPAGHLIYAKGNADPVRYLIEQAGVTVVCHALDLSQHPRQIEAQIDAIVEEALRGQPPT